MVCSSYLVKHEPVGLNEKVCSELRLKLKDLLSLPVSQAGVVGISSVQQETKGTGLNPVRFLMRGGHPHMWFNVWDNVWLRGHYP